MPSSAPRRFGSRPSVEQRLGGGPKSSANTRRRCGGRAAQRGGEREDDVEVVESRMRAMRCSIHLAWRGTGTWGSAGCGRNCRPDARSHRCRRRPRVRRAPPCDRRRWRGARARWSGQRVLLAVRLTMGAEDLRHLECGAAPGDTERRAVARHGVATRARTRVSEGSSGLRVCPISRVHQRVAGGGPNRGMAEQSWMVRTSVPASSRWVAKQCRNRCGVTRLREPDRRRRLQQPPARSRAAGGGPGPGNRHGPPGGEVPVLAQRREQPGLSMT